MAAWHRAQGLRTVGTTGKEYARADRVRAALTRVGSDASRARALAPVSCRAHYIEFQTFKGAEASGLPAHTASGPSAQISNAAGAPPASQRAGTLCDHCECSSSVCVCWFAPGVCIPHHERSHARRRPPPHGAGDAGRTPRRCRRRRSRPHAGHGLPLRAARRALGLAHVRRREQGRQGCVRWLGWARRVRKQQRGAADADRHGAALGGQGDGRVRRHAAVREVDGGGLGDYGGRASSRHRSAARHVFIATKPIATARWMACRCSSSPLLPPVPTPTRHLRVPTPIRLCPCNPTEPLAMRRPTASPPHATPRSKSAAQRCRRAC